MEATMARENGGGRFVAFLLGVAAGAAAAILLSPRSGWEAREYIADRGNEMGETITRRAQDLAADVQRRAGTWLDRGRELFEEEAQRLRGAFAAGRDAMRDEIRRSIPPPA
jgi:gas vesicle protein